MVELPRERLLRLGAHALTDPELLALLFGTGQKGTPVLSLAHALLEAGGGLRALAMAAPEQLAELPGVGPARAAQVLAALELGRRVQTAQDKRPCLLTPHDIYAYAWPRVGALPKEAFHVLCLNSRNTLLQDVRVAEGGVDFCAVDPREVFRAALTCRATAVVLLHNHPSGDPSPSVQDLRLTEQICQGADLLGLKVLDHLIIGDGRYCSLAEKGRLGSSRRVLGAVAGEQ